MDDEDRVVCRLDMFEPGRSAIQNTVMAYGRSIVAQNNFGGAFYEVGDFEPGLARVDVSEDYSDCEIVWQDDTISSQVPPRLSTGDGHVWLYSHRRDEPEDVHAYYLTALDFETGEVVSETFVASGKRMDNPMLSVDFLPGGVMVGGVRNGIISVCDSAPDESGTPVCTDDPLAYDESTDKGCGCASGPAHRPLTLVWLLLGLGYLRRARSTD
jgi:MYXO-CTERM domain-containing protein